MQEAVQHPALGGVRIEGLETPGWTALDVDFSSQNVKEKANPGLIALSNCKVVNDDHYHKHLPYEKFVKLWQPA